MAGGRWVCFHLRRERRAEKLRRSFAALGREQNNLFESLAEYTHEVQAEVRALQISRDRLNAEQLPSSGQDDVFSTSSSMAPVRLGRPLVLGDRWVSFDAAAAGVFSCGLLGFVAGVVGWGWRHDKVVRGSVRRSDSTKRRRLHDD